MDGIARVSVESHIMEYIMRCMYATFVKIQKGLRVVISWHRDDDTVMITSTQRSAVKDIHHALNRFFILYNTVKRNLTFEYCAVLGSTHNLLFVTNQLATRYRRIYAEKARNEYEIKLWGFKSELERAIRFVRQLSGEMSHRLQTPSLNYFEQAKRSPRKPRSNIRAPVLPRIEKAAVSQSNNRIRTWVHEPTIFENHVKEALRDVLPEEDRTHIVYSESFGKKLSELKYGHRPYRKTQAPSRYSTSEMKRLPEKTNQPKKTSTFPKLTPVMRANAMSHEDSHNQIHTPTGLVISCTLRDEAFSDRNEVLVTEISRTGRLSEELLWMIAKERAYEIKKIIRLHISMYGESTPSKVIVTPSFQLQYKQLIHVTPPSWDEERVKKSLKQLLNAYKNIFQLADHDIRTDRIAIPVLGRCETAAYVFPELVALSTMNQAILSSTKAGFGRLRHIRILCSRQTELDYIKSKLFHHVMSLQYDPRYLQQQRMTFVEDDESLTDSFRVEGLNIETDTPT